MISEFTKQRQGTGTREWAEINHNIQKGCSNGCLYCYARANALRYRTITDRKLWESEILNPVAVNKRWAKNKGVIMFPSAHDITPANLVPAITTLRNILAVGNSVLIVSKPRFECVNQLCDEFKQYRSQILFRFTIGSINPDVCAFWEPGAPGPDERITAACLAKEKGYQTSVSMEPMLEGTDGAISTYYTVKPFATEDIWIGKMNKMRTRVDISNLQNLKAVERLERLQRDEEILRLVYALSDEPQVQWKDSIKAVIAKYTSMSEGRL